MSDSTERPLALIADDDPVVRLTLSATLQNVGFRVEAVSDGAQAVEAFARLTPNLIALDVLMPEMDGFDACAKIRAMPRGRHVPILMLTGQDTSQPIGRLLHEPMEAVVVLVLGTLVLLSRSICTIIFYVIPTTGIDNIIVIFCFF